MTINKLKKGYNSMKRLALPYQIGFVIGHSHLTNHQVSKIWRVLCSENNDGIVNEYEQQFTRLIGHGYGISFAAGRMAFFALLRVLNVGVGDEVILPGLTCAVMANAIWRTGATPVFADIDSNTFGSSVRAIREKLSSRSKLIVAQHSFGIPCNIREIVELGKNNGIFILEDCALTLDSAIDGIKVGNYGDAAIFSTDHTKPLNTLIGGFFYTKDKSLYKRISKFSTFLQQLKADHQERLYKRFLYERRNYIPKYFPRSIFINNVQSVIRRLCLKHTQFTFLEADYKKQPSNGTAYPYPAKIPPFLAQLGIYELDRWDKEKRKRINLLNDYINNTERAGLKKYLPAAYFNRDLEIVPLRFVFRHPSAEKLIKIMFKNFIDINGILFRKGPIIGGLNVPESVGYCYGSCPISEETVKEIINWPCVIPFGWESIVLRLFQNTIHDTKY